MYKPKSFVLSELMPPQEMARFGESLCWSFLNPALLVTLQTIRNRHGRLRPNTSALGMHQRGFRGEAFVNQTSGSNTSSKRLNFIRSGSAHKRGDAVDFDPLDTTIAAIHKDFRDNPDKYPFLSFVEVDVNWVHIDVRNAPDITFWSPKRGVTEIVKRTVEFNWDDYVYGPDSEGL